MSNNPKDYHNRIKDYYASTENSYIDSWAMNEMHALHYGYTDDKTKRFKESLHRMNEVMMLKA